MPRYVAILDVGHGNAAVVADDDWVAVVDAGPGSALLQFLQGEKINRIDELLISHADEDHIGGLVGILTSGEFSIGRIRLNSDAAKDSRIWDDLLRAIDDAERMARIDFRPSLTPADSGAFDHGEVQLEILAPTSYLASKGPGSKDRAGKTLTTNSVSAVIRLSVAGHHLVLFPGDIDELTLDELSAVGITELKADILVFPHHGGRGGAANHVAFASRITELVQPLCVVFSIGRGKYNTPSPEVVAEVRRVGGQIRVACTQLSEHCAPSEPGVAGAHLNRAFARGRERNACCAGTLLVELAAPRLLFPEYDPHQQFISANAPTALCRR